MEIDNAEKTDTTHTPTEAAAATPSSGDAATKPTTEEEEPVVGDKMEDESRTDSTSTGSDESSTSATTGLPDNVIIGGATDAASSMDEEPISLADSESTSATSTATAGTNTSNNTLDNEVDLVDDGEVIVKEESDFESDLWADRDEALEGKKIVEKADPEVKMWKYREYGAPYFPSNYEIERMDFLIAKESASGPKEGGADEGRKFFVIEQHLGDYFGKQCFRLFTHSGSATTGASMVQEDEKWCLYFDNRAAAETKYKQIIEEKLASKYVEYELCFVPPPSLLIGSDVAQDQIETGRYIIERLERYTASPSEEEAYDLVEKLFNALNTYRPSSPLCQLLQSFSVVRHVLENSFFLVDQPQQASKSAVAAGSDGSAKAEAEAAAKAPTSAEATTSTESVGDNNSGDNNKNEGEQSIEKKPEGSSQDGSGDASKSGSDGGDKMETKEDTAAEVKSMDVTTDEQPKETVSDTAAGKQHSEEEETSPEAHAERELQKLKVDVMHEWREVLFRLIECGTEFRGYYRQHKTVPIFEELSAKADFYLSVLLQPFASFHAPPGSVNTVNMTVGTIVPFGKDRLQTVKFVSVLTRAKNEVGVEDLLIREDSASGRRSLLFYCVESLFLFPWNNILHSYIVDIVKNILCDTNPLDAGEVDGEDDSPFFSVQANSNKRLEHYLLSQCALVNKILALFRDDAALAKSGHLGHLTIISNCIEERGDELFAGVELQPLPPRTAPTPSTSTNTTSAGEGDKEKEQENDKEHDTTTNTTTPTTDTTPSTTNSTPTSTTTTTDNNSTNTTATATESGAGGGLLAEWHAFVNNKLKEINDVEQTIVYKPKTYPRFSFLNF
eukprot:TRINITY_DN54_c1_g1_i1.p1 TRINITY_DN54_c1_g1~~TRINITY_DN54_c1_g1_i1.p1  ORF type:complete len:843 (+),score=233.70 TRINITY_DN54_c1_g1_i1:188-2716(+)